MTKIYTFGNSKGGVGKSTLAVQVGLGLHIRGHNVWMVDGDEQGNTIDAITMRSARGQSAPDAAHYYKGDVLRAQVKQQAPRYDYVIIDAGGNDNAALRAGLLLSHAAVVPFKPRGFDTWALPKFDAVMLDVLTVNDALQVYALINEADSQGGDNTEALGHVSDFPYMNPLELMIGSRKIIPTASTTGRYVEELRTSKQSVLSAIAEINALVSMAETGNFAVRAKVEGE